ncbi:MAG: PASTA domain-containing protein [Treponema sp.]|jgi:cell division protein FtsI (penicillin-binding protein 3)|nr:PASTA domain-containing protein [Treponema sp.]
MMDYHEHNQEKKLPVPSKVRFLISIFLLCIVAFYILIKFAEIMLNDSSQSQSVTTNTFQERGPILDRNGRILALQTRLGNITLWKPEMKDLDILSHELEAITGIPANELAVSISESRADFVYIQKRVDQSVIKAVETAKADGELRGVGIEPVLGRIYPEKNLASQIIGFVGDDADTGLAGIEYAFESELAPQNSSTGNRIGGSQVILTIDSNVQYILEEIAEKTLTENKAEAVMLIAMNPKSGDILGSASLPSFDPNDIRNSDEMSRMDRSAIWAYEPGSVFKVFSLAALMDSGSIDENTIFNCNGRYERTTNTGETITIRCLGSHGNVTAREIMIYSCNAGAAYAADTLSSSQFYQSMRNFGFGARTFAGNSGETAGVFRAPERWSARSKPTIAMGQEISVSAYQMVQAASAIANEGMLVHPKIVSRIISNDGKVIKTYNNGDPERIINGETSRAIRRYMEDVTLNIGTGWRANVEDISLAVKTGTAQLINPETGAYSDTDFIASCIALLPAENPSLILYIAIVKPQGSSYLGGRIAAPPIREAAESLIDYIGIPRGRNPQVSHTGTITVNPEVSAEIGENMPDFAGFSKRQLMPLLMREDLHVEIRGDGWVVRQNPQPGTPLNSGDSIILELE